MGWLSGALDFLGDLNIPFVSGVANAAESLVDAKGKSNLKASTSSKKSALSSQWVAWAPNWAIVTGGVGILGLIAWAIWGRKKKRRR